MVLSLRVLDEWLFYFYLYFIYYYATECLNIVEPKDGGCYYCKAINDYGL